MSKAATSVNAVKLLPLDQILPTVDLVGYFQYEKDACPVYRNPSHHFILVEAGRVEGDVAQGHFEAKAGDLLCFQPAERNEYRILQRASFYQAHIIMASPPQHRSTPFFPGIGIIPLHVPLGGAFDEMREQFETFCLAILNWDAASRLRIQAAVFNMLRIIAGAVKPARDEAVRLDVWERLRWRLASNEGFKLKIYKLAREKGLSVRHFNRMFHLHFGCSPKEYQMRARLVELRRRLCATDVSLKMIAGDLGFADLRNMSRMVRRVLGVSPSDLRYSVPSSVVVPAVAAKRPYPVNRHLVPPTTSSGWFEKFRVH